MKKRTLILIFLFGLNFEFVDAQQISTSRDFQKSDVNFLENESSKRVFVKATGGTDVLNLDNITASGGLDFSMLLSKKFNWHGRLAFNFSGDIKSSEADSTPLSTLYFPDIGTSSFLSSTEISLRAIQKDLSKDKTLKNELDWDAFFVAEISLQKRNVLKDSTIYKFNIQNASLGLGFKWYHKSEDGNDYLCVRGVFYPLNSLVITGRDERMMSSIFTKDYYDKQGTPLAYNGYSFLISAEFNQTIVYLRTFRDYKSVGEYYFTIGIKAAATFFSF